MRIKSGIAGVVLTLLMASSQLALAETIYLQCGKWDYTVDLTNKTVNDLPATFNETSVDWEQLVGGGMTATVYRDINRVSGTLTEHVQFHYPDGDRSTAPSTYPCTTRSAPSTKF